MRVEELGIEGNNAFELHEFVCLAIKTLRNSCRHPRDRIDNKAMETVCNECDTVLWPISQIPSRFAQLLLGDSEVVKDLHGSIARLTARKEALEVMIAKLQDRCSHPGKEPAPGEREEWCVRCHKDWYQIELRRTLETSP